MTTPFLIYAFSWLVVEVKTPCRGSGEKEKEGSRQRPRGFAGDIAVMSGQK